jgi:hypothetical protein
MDMIHREQPMSKNVTKLHKVSKNPGEELSDGQPSSPIAYEHSSKETELQPDEDLWGRTAPDLDVFVDERSLDDILGYIKGQGDLFGRYIEQRSRRHHRRQEVRILAWVEEGLQVPGYLAQKFALYGEAVSPNASTSQRALYAAAARMGGYSDSYEDKSAHSVRVSRIAKALAGIAAVAARENIEVRYSSAEVLYKLVARLTQEYLWSQADAAEKLVHGQTEPPSDNCQLRCVEEGADSGCAGANDTCQPVSGSSVPQPRGNAPMQMSDSDNLLQGAPVHELIKQNLQLVGRFEWSSSEDSADSGEPLPLIGLLTEDRQSVDVYQKVIKGEQALALVLSMLTHTSADHP